MIQLWGLELLHLGGVKMSFWENFDDEPSSELPELPTVTQLSFEDVVEQIEFLREEGLQPETSLYRFIQTFEKNPSRQLGLFCAAKKHF